MWLFKSKHSRVQAAWIVEDSDQEEGDADDDDDDDMEGAGLDAQAMDDDREGSVISEDDRATSVWDGDDSRSEMMVSIQLRVLIFENLLLIGLFLIELYLFSCKPESRVTWCVM